MSVGRRRETHMNRHNRVIFEGVFGHHAIDNPASSSDASKRAVLRPSLAQRGPRQHNAHHTQDTGTNQPIIHPSIHNAGVRAHRVVRSSPRQLPWLSRSAFLLSLLPLLVLSIEARRRLGQQVGALDALLRPPLLPLGLAACQPDGTFGQSVLLGLLVLVGELLLPVDCLVQRHPTLTQFALDCLFSPPLLCTPQRLPLLPTHLVRCLFWFGCLDLLGGLSLSIRHCHGHCVFDSDGGDVPVVAVAVLGGPGNEVLVGQGVQLVHKLGEQTGQLLF
mmetsp:Transcript_11143/g.32305  ORF Transcript_11143/g.32305 Transcript_11143/m.32305 type:complete len:276 (-) Transcript_11143:1141-1968(-)